MTQPNEADDYEYDLAHEADQQDKPHGDAPRPQTAPPAMHVEEDGGDYGYDAAHDRA